MQKIRKKKKISDTTLRRAVVFTIVFIIFVAVFGVISLAILLYNESSGNEGEKSFVYSQKNVEKLNLLLIGTDSLIQNDSSAFIIIQLDFSNSNIPVTAVPGEIKITYENKTASLSGHMKYGGVNQAKAAVESFFNIKIDNYAVTQLGSFEGIIDKLGGIRYIVPEKILSDAEGGTGEISLESGEQKLTGSMCAELIKYTGWQGESRRNTPAAGGIAAAALNQYLKPDYLEQNGLTIFKFSYNFCRSDFALSDFIDLLPYLKSIGGTDDPAVEVPLGGSYNSDRTLFTPSSDGIENIAARYKK